MEEFPSIPCGEGGCWLQLGRRGKFFSVSHFVSLKIPGFHVLDSSDLKKKRWSYIRQAWMDYISPTKRWSSWKLPVTFMKVELSRAAAAGWGSVWVEVYWP